MSGGSTPSRYSSAVPRSFGSSVCRPRYAICSGAVGSTSDEQREDVGQALAGAVLQKLVHERSLLGIVDAVEQTMALPHRPADRDLLADHVEDALAIDAHARVLLEDRRQRAAALEADLEAQVLEAEQQAVNRPLRHAHREHARQPAADGERLIGIEQRVDQLADPLLGDLSQRAHRILSDRIPGEQRDHVRDQRRRQALVVCAAR